MRFMDGRKVMLSGKTRDLQPILAAGFNMKDAPPAQPPTIVITAQPDPRRLTSPPQLLGAPPTPPWGAAPSPESAAAPLGESVPKPQLADAADNPPSR